MSSPSTNHPCPDNSRHTYSTGRSSDDTLWLWTSFMKPNSISKLFGVVYPSLGPLTTRVGLFSSRPSLLTQHLDEEWETTRTCSGPLRQFYVYTWVVQTLPGLYVGIVRGALRFRWPDSSWQHHCSTSLGFVIPRHTTSLVPLPGSPTFISVLIFLLSFSDNNVFGSHICKTFKYPTNRNIQPVQSPH